MAIWITGDIHGGIDIAKLSYRRWPEGRLLTREDFVIIAGDFGMPWSGSNDELYWLDWLNNRPWTTLYVDGNHECYPYLEDLPVTERWGGKVQVYPEYPNIIRLMRGQVFDLPNVSRGAVNEGDEPPASPSASVPDAPSAPGLAAPPAPTTTSPASSTPPTWRVFTMGGADSHDKEWRTPGLSWFPEELPSWDEYAEAERNLAAADWQVDLAISHCCGTRWLPAVLPADSLAEGITTDALTTWFDDIEDRLSFRMWLFGHYHTDVMPDARHRALYRDIVSVNELLAESGRA